MAASGTYASGKPLLSIRIDKRSPVRAYAQIAERIKDLLDAGVIPAGSPLPPERVLCECYGVRRMTLRQAYSALERDVLIESHRGRGTFVAPRRTQKKQQEMHSFTEGIRARGAVLSSKLLAFRSVRPERRDRDFFRLPEQEELHEVERVRFSDESPVAPELLHIPRRICPYLDRSDLASQSIYRILEQHYGPRLAPCTEQISAAHPTRRSR